MPARLFHFFQLPLVSAHEIDEASHTIKGVTVITSGVTAKGHGLEVDDTTVRQIVECGAKAGKVQMKYDHKSGVTAVGGYLTNFRVEADKGKADLVLLRTHEETPKTLERAWMMPECFGLSAAFAGPEKGERIGGKNYARCSELIAVDCVTNPAACPTGLFSARVTRLRKGVLTRLMEFRELPDKPEPKRLPSWLEAGLSAAVSGGALGALGGLRRGSTVSSTLRSIGAGAGLGAAAVGGGTIVGGALLGPEREDEGAPITKRAALGGSIVGAGLGAGAALALRRGARLPGIGTLSDAAQTWRPARWAQRASLPAVAGIGGVAGAAVVGGHAADEGQQVDTFRSLRKDRQKPIRREFAEGPRARNSNGEFVQDTSPAVTPGMMTAAYGNVQSEKVARRRNLLTRLKILGKGASGAPATAGGGGILPLPLAPSKIASAVATGARLLPISGARAGRLQFAARVVHEFKI